MLALHREHITQPFHMGFGVARSRRRPLRCDQPLGLQEPDLGNRICGGSVCKIAITCPMLRWMPRRVSDAGDGNFHPTKTRVGGPVYRRIGRFRRHARELVGTRLLPK